MHRPPFPLSMTNHLPYAALLLALALAPTRGQEAPPRAAEPPPAAAPAAAPAEAPAEDPAEPPAVAELDLEQLLPERPPAPSDPAQLPQGPTANATVNLISRLVQKGILSKAEALELIQQAEQDALAVREEMQAALPPPIDPTGQRVTYIPEVVREEMRSELRQEMMAVAREEEWGSVEIPEWTSSIDPGFDFLLRYEGFFFDDGNSLAGSFPNFNAINTGLPFDTTGNVFSPQYNVDEDRHRLRIRVRAGADIMLGDGFTIGLRAATGDSNSPTSVNQSLGGSGGNFSKYALWLDRAHLKFDPDAGEDQYFRAMFGRFDSPFFATEMMWDDDLGFDGLAATIRVRATDTLHAFATAGAFPVFNTDLNFASNQPDKFKSNDKWLYALQTGIDWKIDKDWSAKFAGAYYYFDKVEGKLSSPFVPLTASDAGDTDASRPSFAQRGNTYFPIRNIIPTAANNFGTINQFQYYGLATPFENLTFTGRVDYDGWEPLRFSAVGEVVKNLAFRQGFMEANAVNNRGAGGAFEGGDMGWYLALIFGKPALEKFGDWTVGLGYRYVESDAVVDAFADSDFGGGGTNVRGFTLGGTMAITPDVRARIRWMSADEIAGPPLKSDIIQIDLNARY